MRASTGNFLHVEVNQLGIDVALTLYGPDGKQIGTMDSPNGDHGPEKISAIADVGGVFRLEVASGDASARPGRFTIRMSPLRPPSASDRARINAERLTVAALQLASESTAEAKRHAAQEYEDALPLWRTAGDQYEEALTLSSLGEVYASLTQMEKALDCFRKALTLERVLHDQYAEAVTLNDIGYLYDHSGEKHEALDYYDRALRLLRATGNFDGAANTLNNIGLVYRTLGDLQKALDYYNRALPLIRSLGDHSEEARLLNNIGKVYDSLGQKQKALDDYNQSLNLWQAAGDLGEQARTLNNIGLVYDSLGEEKVALDYYARALPLRRQAGDAYGEAYTLTNIGTAYATLGDSQKALDYYSQALPLRRKTRDRNGEGWTLTDIGNVYAAQGRKQEALAEYEQALKIENDVGDRDEAAITLTGMGTVLSDLGDTANALKDLQRSEELFVEVKDTLSEGAALTQLMRYWKAANQPQTAIFFGKQAVNRFQEIRANIQGLAPEAQKSFVLSKEKTYRELASLLISQGRLLEAQQVLDMLKDQEFFDFIRGNGRSATSPSTYTTTETSLDARFRALANRLITTANNLETLQSKPARTPDEDRLLSELPAQLDAADRAFEQFLTTLPTPLTASAVAPKHAAPFSQSMIQTLLSRLDPGTVALYTLVTDEKYQVILITPSKVVARETPIPLSDLRSKVQAFRQSLSTKFGDPLPMAQDLYTILVAPVAQDLADAKATTLLWSLDEVLRYIPMEALNDGQSYLVEKYRNVVFTPRSLPGLADRAPISEWSGLGMGVSKSYTGFDALPSVPAELDSVIRAPDSPQGIVPGEILLNETFTLASMKVALKGDYSLIHIASHFYFSPGNETDSFLLVGSKNSDAGEHLTLADLRSNPAFDFRKTKLLTLSACETAVGDASGDGREVDGLAYVAHDKGAEAVLASLWDVNDASTGLLMQDLYRLWTTQPSMSKAEALRRAQLDLLHGNSISAPSATAPTGANAPPPAAIASRRAPYANPYYWAPFVLIGNPR